MKKLTCLLLVLSCFAAKAQVAPRGLKGIITAVDSSKARLPIEKLYVQTDKPYYTAGDTLWFKSYLLNADYLTPSTRSGLLYLELDNSNNQMIKRIMVPVTSGISRGDMALNEEEIPAGSYTLRAYTNWMRNFSEDYIFKKNIYIAALSNSTLLNKQAITADQAGKNQTDATIPMMINHPENMDIQFMPEGGNMIAGIPTKVGFKAISEDGKGTNISGKIINSKNQTITSIQTIHKGMGSFELTPEANETYTAVINLPNKTTKSYPLPKVNPTGTALRITPKGNDSLEITLTATASATNNYYLIGQARGVVCYAAAISFKEQTVKKTIAKNLFPTGITRFTLLNQSDQPLNERVVYIDHNDNLNISINSNKPSYTKRDSIALNIQVKDKEGNPIHGTFGLAVTDNSLVKADTTGSNIINDLLFTSDLKGTVEEPDWYFENDNPTIKQSDNKTIALDNLLLTQGWVGYDWKDVFQTEPAPIQFPAEKEFIVQGKVTNLFNKPVEQSQVVLMGKLPVVVRDTVTGKDGIFTFKGLFPIDTAEFKLEARNKNGKTFNVGIAMLNVFTPPVFTPAQEQPMQGYISGDTTLLNNDSTKTAQLKAEADYRVNGHLLKTVEIKDKKIIPDSRNKNGPGEADETLTEKDIKQVKPDKTLFGLLKEKFKSYTSTLVLRNDDDGGYYTFHRNELYGHWIIPYIDGVPATPEMAGKLRAEDIKGIEVMRTGRYAMAYDPAFVTKEVKYRSHEDDIPIFLEITTYAGHASYFSRVPGTAVYRPMPFTLPMKFYKPRYTVKNINIAPGTDMRSTIHWEPNVITDKNGKATVSFFSADKPADYTVMMEGTDLNGNLGYKRQQIKVVLAGAGK